MGRNVTRFKLYAPPLKMKGHKKCQKTRSLLIATFHNYPKYNTCILHHAHTIFKTSLFLFLHQTYSKILLFYKLIMCIYSLHARQSFCCLFFFKHFFLDTIRVSNSLNLFSQKKHEKLPSK